MKAFAEQKIKGGKLVGVSIEYDDRIRSIRILGDFFIHPEESLYKMEKALIGMNADSSGKEMVAVLNGVIAAEKAELIGVTPEAIAETIGIAVRKRSGE